MPDIVDPDQQRLFKTRAQQSLLAPLHTPTVASCALSRHEETQTTPLHATKRHRTRASPSSASRSASGGTRRSAGPTIRPKIKYKKPPGTKCTEIAVSCI
eukprot:3492174-Rhodomonas_salina.1